MRVCRHELGVNPNLAIPPPTIPTLFPYSITLCLAICLRIHLWISC